MKNRVALSLIYLVAGLLVILIPTVLLPVCGASEKKMACHYTKQAEIGVGAIIIFSGIAVLVLGNELIRAGISLYQAAVAVLVVLLPAKLTGLCKMSEMSCRAKTYPGLIVIGVLLFVVSVAEFIYLFVKNGKDNHDKESA